MGLYLTRLFVFSLLTYSLGISLRCNARASRQFATTDNSSNYETASNPLIIAMGLLENRSFSHKEIAPIGATVPDNFSSPRQSTPNLSTQANYKSRLQYSLSPRKRELADSNFAEPASQQNPTEPEESDTTPNADSASPLFPNAGEAVDLSPDEDLLDLPASPEVLEIDNIISLTLEQVIRLAETNNRSLEIARVQLRRDHALLDHARAQLYPTLSLQGQISRQLDPSSEISTNATRNQLTSQIAETEAAINTIESALPGITDPLEEIILTLQLSDLQQNLQSSQTTLSQLNSYPTTTLSGGVQVDYALYSPRRTASIQQAEAQADFTELEVNRLREEIRLQVTNAYYDLQDAEAQAEIFRADIERRNRSLRDIEALLGAGLATRLDQLNSQVELDASRQNLINAESQVQSAQSTLVQILSIPPGIAITAAESVATVDPWGLSLEETIFLALHNRVELNQQLAQRQIAEGQRRAALAGTRPQVNLFATYDVLNLSTSDPRASSVEGFGDGYSLGLSVSWLLLDGGAANAGARAAEANIEVADLQFSETSNQIRAEITQAYASLLANTENLETAQNAVERAEEALRIARLRFQAGVGTQSDVLDADFRLTEALGNVKTAALGYNRSVAALQRFVGISASQSEVETE